MYVWAIFSIANEYDQPDNNLVKLFKTKPNVKKLIPVFFPTKKLETIAEDDLAKLMRLLNGRAIPMYSEYGTEYRIEKVAVTE